MLLSRLLGGSLFRAATPENPTFDLNSPEAWDAFVGGARSDTGQPVTPESALSWDVWYRGVTLLASYIAKTPLAVLRNVDRGRTAATDHPAYRLLRWQANEFQTAFQVQFAWAMHAINRGNGYCYVWRDGPTPVELTLLDPDRTYPAPNSGGQWYVTTVGGEQRRLPAADVLHLMGPSFDGVSGYPVFQLAKNVIGLGHAQTKFKALRFKNQARPGVVLQSDQLITPQVRQETKEDWNSMYAGLENSHRTAILGSGLKVQPLTFSAVEMQEVEQSGLSIRQAANFLGIPSSKLCDVAGIKYASKEQDDLAFLNDGLDTWFVAVEMQAWAKLLLESEKKAGEYAVEFDRTKVAQGDSTARATASRTSLAGQPWKTQNEVRAEYGLPPSDDPEADRLRVPLNMGQGGDQNQPDNVADPGPGNPGRKAAAGFNPAAQPAPLPSGVRAAAAVSLSDATRRAVMRVGVQAVKAAKEPGKFTTWVDGLAAEYAEATRGTLEPARQLVLALNGEPADSPVFGIGEAVLARVRTAFDAVADTATAKHLPAAVEAAVADLEAKMPAWAVSTFLPGVQP